MEDKTVLMFKNIKKRTLILFILIFSFSFIDSAIAGSGWIIYREGAFKGIVIDSETKEPIEGVVVVAIYRIREYSFVESGTAAVDAKEVLTDKNGEFYISPHIYFSLYPVASGETTEFIIYKPGYRAFDKAQLTFGNPLSIFAIGPSTIGYMELGKKTVNGHTIEFGSKKTKTYPEGLMFSGEGCKKRIDSIKQSTPFMIDYIFLPLEGARDKIKKLQIPLDCPKVGKAVPHVDQTYNFRNDIKGYINKSFVIIELSKLSTWDERRKTNAISISISERKWPLLNKAIKKEEEWLRRNRGWKRKIK
ncbi:MAG TPA: hypothetical protein ENH28_02155 [Euryarchaeota archaeon]|nr:hypothetical protein [Euryarchaeota archaeon]